MWGDNNDEATQRGEYLYPGTTYLTTSGENNDRWSSDTEFQKRTVIGPYVQSRAEKTTKVPKYNSTIVRLVSSAKALAGCLRIICLFEESGSFGRITAAHEVAPRFADKT